jgi:hypothetical protein
VEQQHTDDAVCFYKSLFSLFVWSSWLVKWWLTDLRCAVEQQHTDAAGPVRCRTSAALAARSLPLRTNMHMYFICMELKSINTLAGALSLKSGAL